jgi:hypothetical protein
VDQEAWVVATGVVVAAAVGVVVLAVSVLVDVVPATDAVEDFVAELLAVDVAAAAVAAFEAAV